MSVHHGGCQCGAVRYSIDIANPVVYACHCRDCQKHTTSACALSMPVPFDDLSVDGPLATFERPTESGTTTACVFCSMCGTRVYHRSARSQKTVTLKGGTLDDTSSLRPVAHVWVSRKQPWVVLPDDVPQYETQPDDLKAWRAELMAAADV